MDYQTAIRTTQALGITSAFLMAGMNFVSSFLFIKPLLPLPTSESTRIFAYIYHTGAGVLVPVALGSAALNGVSAYVIPSSRTEYVAAAVAAAGTMAWTGAVMLPGIGRLLEVSKANGSEIQDVKKQEVVNLLNAWKGQNYVRAGLGFLAGVLSLYAMMK